jgi:hypothetical protein
VGDTRPCFPKSFAPSGSLPNMAPNGGNAPTPALFRTLKKEEMVQAMKEHGTNLRTNANKPVLIQRYTDWYNLANVSGKASKADPHPLLIVNSRPHPQLAGHPQQLPARRPHPQPLRSPKKAEKVQPHLQLSRGTISLCSSSRRTLQCQRLRRSALRISSTRKVSVSKPGALR